MADRDLADGLLSPAQRRLANPSDQEALELDLTLCPALPPLSTTSTRQGEGRITRWWRRYIEMGVPHTKCRDHLANERTYLGYLRTGQAFAILGAVIAQVLRLHHSLTPNPVIGFFVVSVPLSCVCHVTAIIISALGALRFLRYQKEMARGYAVSGGWEIKCVGILATLIVLCMFVLVLAITIEKG
ncbi:hypothetical protein A1O1_01523 [Capronia coronata CBS 617.96]|uniref:DUF202 domain-containing protein n=1 Tax=Capronia coronata CBS 617.96 TaxID=1182541 RepID=W9YU38_9EURO|nr:uncharacterized protein A1O1_01523 [Capronia coronata CBS 617.96]EXJ96397.1 hypothetical protein A1O1_01523 [Capronia coronata CBS 617.96]